MKIRLPACSARPRRGHLVPTVARAAGTALLSSMLTAALFTVSAVAAAIGTTSVLTAALPAAGPGVFTTVTRVPPASVSSAPVPPAPVPPPPRAAPGPASHGPRPGPLTRSR